MSTISNSSTGGTPARSFSSIAITTSIKFWTYAVFDGLSVLCTSFVLCHLLFDRTLRHALNNHIIILLLFLVLTYELINMPWTLHQLWYGRPWIQAPVFYLFSFFFDYGVYTTQIVLFAWATIERHILIFHDAWVSTRKKRLFVHYLPIVAIMIYCLVYFSLVTFGPFCENSSANFVTAGVLLPCLYKITVFGAWDFLVHQLIPTLIVATFSLALIIRVLWRKRTRNQPIQWRKHRKMTVQLVSISALYLLFNLPWTTLIFASLCGLPSSVTITPLQYAEYFRAYVIFLFPFICCGSLAELREKLTKLVCYHRRNRIAPVKLVTMTHTVHK